MTIEELLKPRYKVIADYPHNVVPVGEILFIIPHQGNVDVSLWMSKYDEFPHLFKKLEWWEERDKKDMPEYVKHKVDSEVYKLQKQAEHTPSDAYCIKRTSIDTESYYQWVSLYDLLPATYEEYVQSP